VEVARAPLKVNGAVYFELRVGRLVEDRATILATRGEIDSTIIGTVSSRTIPAPRPRVTLELPRHGKIDFVPTNRDAVLTVADLGEDARLVPLSEEGAYAVRPERGHYLLRGDENAGGFLTLVFGYRRKDLPPELSGTNLAVIGERTQRAVREASVPAPFSTAIDGETPLSELLCSDRQGNPRRLEPAKPHQIGFEERHTCRIVIHADRLSREYGQQEVELEVDVTGADGRRRGEASFSQRMILVPGAAARVVPLKGGVAEFDQIVVRLSHVLDETRYALNPTARGGTPAVQWSAFVRGGRFRLYATAAIPAGLYRINQPTGQLTLNFGVLSRITWLDQRGKESLLGAELGLMGMGLIQRPGAIEYPPTLGAIAGLGIRVPLGTGGAAVGVHIWGAYEFREGFEYYRDVKKMEGLRTAPRVAIIFGPSISIGNVGTNF
jgi:hypothetical protein